MESQKLLSREELKDRAIRFYNRYSEELFQVSELLRIQLSQTSLAYTLQNKLPKEAVTVKTRVKSIDSFLLKLSIKNWPQFYYPTDIIKDLIGARITCFFLDDCFGIFEHLKQSKRFIISDENVRNYINKPLKQGYRAIHLLTNISYDSVQRDSGGIPKVVDEGIVCEIQIRSKLQDSWADITHEFYYKNRAKGIKDDNYEKFLSRLAERLYVEDKEFLEFRNIYQQMADDKDGTREGFKDD